MKKKTHTTTVDSILKQHLQSTTMTPPTWKMTTSTTIRLLSTSTNLRHNRKPHADLNDNSKSERDYTTMRKRSPPAINLGTCTNGYLNNRRLHRHLLRVNFGCNDETTQKTFLTRFNTTSR